MKNRIYRLALSDELVVLPEDVDGSFNSINDLLEAIKEPSIILIDGVRTGDDNIVKETFNAVYQLRRSEKFYAAPIYFAKSMGKLDAFVDGIKSTEQDILTHASGIVSKMYNISIEKNAANNDLRLLTFLFCREESYYLSPLSLVGSPWIYEYPAAYFIGGLADNDIQSAFRFNSVAEINSSAITMKNSTEWLVSLYSQGFLITMGLVDRIRLCPHCQTGNLNYKDFCPACSSIDFTKTKMIHCFTCAHVAPEENFRNEMMFVCPRCSSTLRHIGTDYDRPVEAYSCNSCAQRFIEPEVKADCLTCRRKSATNNLTVRQLYNYGLTAKGNKAVQLGIMDLEFSLFDSNRNVVPLYFYQVSDWLLQLKVRFPDEEFSLLCIKIIGIEELERMAGISQVKNLIDEIALRIRELVRITDITMSAGANTFWILLPRTEQKGGEILASKVEKLADMVSLGNGLHVNLQVKCFSIPTEYAKRGSVTEMLLSEYEATFGR